MIRYVIFNVIVRNDRRFHNLKIRRNKSRNPIPPKQIQAKGRRWHDHMTQNSWIFIHINFFFYHKNKRIHMDWSMWPQHTYSSGATQGFISLIW